MAEASTSQTSSADLGKMKKEKDDNYTEGHLHYFSFEYEKDQIKHDVTCNSPRTVLEVLEGNPHFKYDRDRKIPIIKMGGDKDDGVIATHFPCHLIKNNERLIISFARRVDENVHKPQPCVLQQESYVTFTIATKGGENTHKKPLLRNTALTGFTYLCVYAEKGITVREALKRDGRFHDYITDDFSLWYDLHRVNASNIVDSLSGKRTTLTIPLGRTSKSRGAQASAKGDNEISTPSFVLRSGNKPAARMTSDAIAQRANRRVVPENGETPEDILKVLREKFPALKEWMMSRFPGNEYQKAVKLKREEFGKIEQAFSEVHRVRQLINLSDSVCMIEVSDGSCQGTGFVLFDNFILTNAHILKDCVQLQQNQRQLTKEVFAIFKHENLLSVPKSIVKANEILIDFEYNEDMKERDLDYAILELEQTARIPKGLLSRCGPVPRNGGACIIGHPAGGVKKMDLTCIIEPESREESVERELEPFKGCLLLYVIKNDLKDQSIHNIMKGGDKKDKVITYNTFMYHGASGSPVFDDKGQVFGLHTAGFVYYDGVEENEKSVTEYAFPLSAIIQRFMSNLDKSEQKELLEKVQKEAKKSMCNLLPMTHVDESMEVND